MVRVSVLSICYRPGYFDTMREALQAQAFPREDFEFVVVDELAWRRENVVRDYIGDSLQLTYVPLEPKEWCNTKEAFNTGLRHCQGELVYMMADYMYPHPHCLSRHWDIYQRYGPKVFISGPLVDRVTSKGESIHQTNRPVPHTVLVGERPITYFEWSPPIEWPLKPNYREPTEDNLISIFERPFEPSWPQKLPSDWRLGAISDISLEPGLYEFVEGFNWTPPDGPKGVSWFWCGRNDSAPLQALRAVGGLPGRYRQHGGWEVVLGNRLKAYGCRYLLDRLAPAFVLPHPTRKKEEEFNAV